MPSPLICSRVAEIALEAVCSSYIAETEKDNTQAVQKNREEVLVSWVNQPGARGLGLGRFCCFSENHIKINRHKYVFKKYLAEPLKCIPPAYTVIVIRRFGDSKISLCCGDSGESFGLGTIAH